MKGKVYDKIPVKNVIVSVFDKTGLDIFIPGLIEASPDIRFISTGGTFRKINEILGDFAEKYLIEVSEYTKFPAMDGGLVKTLHPKIHAGILGERNNPIHKEYLEKELKDGVFIDMVVGNLYPFNDVIKRPDSTFEQARGNIDIGGPTMMRAAAKNFPGCMAVVNPGDYEGILTYMKANNGTTHFIQRLKSAAEIYGRTGDYDKLIQCYFLDTIANDGVDKIMEGYEFVEGSSD